MVTGAGRAFSTGRDLKVWHGIPETNLIPAYVSRAPAIPLIFAVLKTVVAVSLQESINHTVEDGRRYLDLCYDSANALASLPMPTIAAINGPCFGWGLEAALGCDIRYTVSSASLCFPETRIGIFPGAGGVARLCKLVRCLHDSGAFATGWRS